MRRKKQVILTPTEEKPYPLELWGSWLFDTRDGKYSNREPKPTGQHMHILSPEEVNETCWCVDLNTKKVKLYQGRLSPEYEYAGYRRIIATTAKNLEKLCSCGKNCGAKDSNIVQILPSFIDHYFEQYRKGNIIKEVNVECYQVVKTYKEGTSIPSEYEDQLKLNRGYIVTSPVKDTFTRKEFKEALVRFQDEFKPDPKHRIGLQISEYVDKNY